MKIVLIDKEEGHKIGGLAVYSQRLYNFLSEKGHQVAILRFARKNFRERYIYRLPYYFAEPRSFIFLPSEKTLQLIKKYLIKLKPDVVYSSCGLSPLDFLLPSFCHDLKIPIAGVWHADFNYNLSSYQLLAKSLFLAYLPFIKQLDLLHVFTPKLAKFYINKGIPSKRLLILPNSVDAKLYSPGESTFKKKHKIKTGILFLGRLTIQKNPEVLITSFLNLNPKEDTKLILVGYGEKEEELRETYKDKRIIFTGVVKDEKTKIDIIRGCQIFVLPSRFEGMPLALLEAMSCGLACIASDAGSNKELLDTAGIVIPTNHLRIELPVTLKLLLDYPEFAKILGGRARQKILTEFSHELIFDKLLERFEVTIKDFRQHGYPQISLDLNTIINKNLRTVWQKVKQLGSYF